VAELVQLGLSSVVFFVLARALQPDDFGRYTAVIALTVIAGHLSNAGAHALMIERVAHGEDIAVAWPRALATITIGTTVGAGVLLLVRPVVIPSVELLPYLLFVLTWLNLFWLVEGAVTVAVACRQLQVAARLRVVNAVIRVGSLLAFVAAGGDALDEWAWFGLGGALVGFGAVLLLLDLGLGLAPAWRRPRGADIRRGFPFALNYSTEGLFDAADRPILLRYGWDADAGRYSIASRIVQLGLIPLVAIARSSDRDVFEHGAGSTTEALTFTKRLLGPAVGFGILAGVGLLVGAPLVPVLVGEEYRETVTIMRVLAIIPLVKAFQIFGGNILLGSGHAKVRLLLTLAAAGINVPLNFLLIPAHSWKGAVTTTIVCEILLAAAIWIAVLRIARRERAQAAADGHLGVILAGIGSKHEPT